MSRFGQAAGSILQISSNPSLRWFLSARAEYVSGTAIEMGAGATGLGGGALALQPATTKAREQLKTRSNRITSA
jgi:hypothetical protein